MEPRTKEKTTEELKTQYEQALAQVHVQVDLFDQAETAFKNATDAQRQAAEETLNSSLKALEEAKLNAMLLHQQFHDSSIQVEQAKVATEIDLEGTDPLSTESNLLASTAILNARVSTHEQELSQLSDRVNSLEGSTTPSPAAVAPQNIFSRALDKVFNFFIDGGVKLEQMIFRPKKETSTSAKTSTTASSSINSAANPHIPSDTINGSMPKIAKALAGLDKELNTHSAPRATTAATTPSPTLATVRDQKPFFVSPGLRLPRVYCHLDSGKMDEKALKRMGTDSNHTVGFLTTRKGEKLMYIEPLTRVAGQAEKQVKAMEKFLSQVTQNKNGSKPPFNMDDLINRAKTKINSKFLRTVSEQNKAPGIYQLNVKMLVDGKPNSLNQHQQKALAQKLQKQLDAKMESKDDKGVSYAEKQGSRANPQVKFINDKGQTRLQVNFDPKLDKKEQRALLSSLINICNNETPAEKKPSLRL